jgi:hypothetical protein
MQAVTVAIVKATWAWVRGKCEEAMREVLGAGIGTCLRDGGGTSAKACEKVGY